MIQGLRKGSRFAIGFFAYCGEIIISFLSWIRDYFFELIFMGLILLVVIVICAALFPIVDRMLHDKSACYTHDKQSMECISELMEQCLKTEQYTKDQCVTLIGGGK